MYVSIEPIIYIPPATLVANQKQNPIAVPKGAPKVLVNKKYVPPFFNLPLEHKALKLRVVKNVNKQHKVTIIPIYKIPAYPVNSGYLINKITPKILFKTGKNTPFIVPSKY